MTHSSEIEFFLGGPNGKAVAPGIPVIGGWPERAKNRGEPQKMTHSSETENFLGVVLMGKF